ncbi:DUF1015 family protein [Haloechinothrix sp. LS1_15]|uniref:DUF1015 family protein n=1 Tax=Haloechinothrix sp. LS1_15 TaxID=2652248 RepID=UPI00294B6BE4|nr:DUF1015 family protein [Haloechinothrix sp. LS1_15]
MGGTVVRPPRVHLLDPRAARDPNAVADRAGVLRALHDRTFVRVPEPSYVAYQLETPEHRGTAVVAEVAAEAYLRGKIRPHEATAIGKEQELASKLAELGAELVPVTLMAETGDGIRELLRSVTARCADLELTEAAGLTQRAWLVDEPELVRQLDEELAAVSAFYIADGHHRMAAAARYAHRNGNADHYVLGALFDAADMRVIGYHRCVSPPNGLTVDELLDALTGCAGIAWLAECAHAEQALPAPGTVGIHLGGRWFRAGLRVSTVPPDPRANLDAVRLDECVLRPVFGTGEVAADPRVTPVAGTDDAESVARRCAERGEIGFLLHPPTVEQVRTVADAGMVMPPKSTWFEPKARGGPFLRVLPE